MITAENTGPVRILRLDHGKVNALDLEVVRALAREFRELGPSRGIVLTGTDRIFSAGVDLRRLLESDSDYTRAFLTELDALVQTIFEIPVPVVAALTGHTIAGGCLIAAACDYRVMGQGKIGVTEAVVGLPVPPASLEALRFTVGAGTAGLVLTGRTVEATEALALGLIDEIAGPGHVLPRALEMARQFASPPAATFALHKSMLRADARRRMREAVAEHARAAAGAWLDEEPRRFAGEYLAALKSRK
jgi:enoyl-CoA hydratase